MSIRCSLLGHDYGDAETEREREEQGSEVVVTVREFEECQRCGERKIVSENKEVTSIASPAPDRDGESDSTDGRPDASADAPRPGDDTKPNTGTGGMGVPDEAVPAGGDDAEILGDSTHADSDATGDADQSATGDAPAGGRSGGVEAQGDAARSGVENDFDESAADDDAEILKDDPADEADDRTAGEWPEAETTHPAEADEKGPGDWPDVGREDEGFDAEPDDGTRADVEFGGGLTPESTPEVDEDETDEVEFVNASGDTLGSDDAGGRGRSRELSSGISAGAEAPTLSGPSDDLDLDAEFVCPECDYREEASGSSLRAGDICPECGRGYLAQE